MAKECSETTIPRECADEFKAGAERMGRIEERQLTVVQDVKDIKGDVAAIKELVAQGKGLKIVANLLWAAALFVAGLFGWNLNK